MKQLLSLLFFAFSIQLFAQPNFYQGGSRPAIRVFGKVVDAKTNKGLDAVSVQIIKQVTKADGRQADSVVAGMFTRSNGDFNFDNIVLSDSITVDITAIGYEKIEQTMSMAPENTAIEVRELDLGNFSMKPDARVLANVTVVTNRPVMEMGIDRKVFNVEKSITATGGTAVDVMRNIPSVSVDVEGNVQLRNSDPQIFVDGRPTILTLDQIPADNIEKVELITNPSAKFDAQSSGGIINVVLKKNKRIGLNGTASVSAGTPKIFASNLSLNLREGKFNFFVSGNINQSGGKADGKTFRQNKKNGVIENYFNQYSLNDRTRKFKSLRFGLDYFLNNRNTLTITQGFVNGDFNNNETQTQEYLSSNRVLERTGIRTSIGNFGFSRHSTQAVFIHKFAKTGQQITADVNYNRGSGENLSNIINTFYIADGSIFGTPNRVMNDGENNSDQVTIQVDYVNPIGENAKLETGVRSYRQTSTSIFNAFSLGQNNQPTKLPLSNHYKFDEMINAFYVTFSNKIDKFSYQAGLRAEASKFDGTLVDRNQSFGYSYPSKIKNIWDALFPSLFLTQSIGEQTEIQVNYSRRIRRPNFRHLNPFVDINDPVNIQQGNPALRPEFTNSFEFNYNKNYRSGNFLAAIYYRNTMNDITRYSDTISDAQYQQLNNAAVDPNAILNTYINIRSQNRLGLDMTWQQNISKQLEIIPNIQLQYRKVNADLEEINLSNQGWSFETKLITNYRVNAPKSWLFKDLSFQLTGEYESPEPVPQGRRKEQYSVDFAFRKDLFKDKKGTFTFGIDDVFNTRRWGTIYDTENFYQDSYRRWNVRSFRVTFSYKFGDSNFSLFRRNRPSRLPDDREEPNEGPQ